MRSPLNAVPLVAATCVLACSLQTSLLAADGILVTEKTTTASKTETHQIQVEPTRIRVETTNPSGDPMVLIFDGAKQVLWMLEPNKKSYTELTKAEADAMGSQMSGAMAQMQQAMQGMSPAERAQMEAMMRGRGMPSMPGMGGAPATTEYRRAGADTVGSRACVKYEGYQGSQKTSEVCTVEPAAMGFVAADFEVSAQMADFFSKLVPQATDSVFKLGAGGTGKFSGVPIRRVSGIGGRQTTSEVTGAVRQTFPESTFALPADFQKTKLPGQ